MNPMDVFSVRELRIRSGDLLKDAEAGHLSLITKRGKPAILAVPFDKRLLDHGVQRTMALDLFEEGRLTMSQAAKIAGVPLEVFMKLLAEAGIEAVDYSASELEEEIGLAL